MRTFWGNKDILAGPHDFKGPFGGLDVVLRLELELGFGRGQGSGLQKRISSCLCVRDGIPGFKHEFVRSGKVLNITAFLCQFKTAFLFHSPYSGYFFS